MTDHVCVCVCAVEPSVCLLYIEAVCTVAGLAIHSPASVPTHSHPAVPTFLHRSLTVNCAVGGVGEWRGQSCLLSFGTPETPQPNSSRKRCKTNGLFFMPTQICILWNAGYLHFFRAVEIMQIKQPEKRKFLIASPHWCPHIKGKRQKQLTNCSSEWGGVSVFPKTWGIHTETKMITL